MADKIPLTVIVTTLNEEKNLPRCLAALERFDEIIVVDSNSKDATGDIVRSFGVNVVSFVWNGRYPKKRQWCLDTLSLNHDRVFFVDADEEVMPDLCDEIAALDWKAAGYFVKGRYVIHNRPLRFGLKNSKLCLFDRRFIAFPVVDDLDIPGMGEIEGHYQPVLHQKGGLMIIGRLKQSLLHHALEDIPRWEARHDGYKKWQLAVEQRNILPGDPKPLRHYAKTIFSNIPCRAWVAFAHSYLFLGGFLDGWRGFFLAKTRYAYYKNSIII